MRKIEYKLAGREKFSGNLPKQEVLPKRHSK